MIQKFLDPEGSLSTTTVVLLLTWCCYQFLINAYGFVNTGTQRKVTKLRIHIRGIIPDRSAVLDFGATFRVRSTFRTCFYPN